MYCFFVFKQKTAYEMRISDWSSDVCSSDFQLGGGIRPEDAAAGQDDRPFGRSEEGERLFDQRRIAARPRPPVAVRCARPGDLGLQIGRASCRERVCQYV